MILFLKLEECEEVIKREKQNTDTAEWDKKDLKAMNYIYSAILNKQLEFVCDEETAYGTMKKFDGLYLKESTALQIIYRNKLEKLKLKDYNDSATFFSDFEKAINELKGAGANVTSKEKLNYMLNTLPDSYSYIGDLIDTLKEEDQTAEYIKNKIQMAEFRNKKEKLTEKKSNVFAASKTRQERRCYGCGEKGHLQRDCKNGGQSANSQSTWRSPRGRRGRGNDVRGRSRYWGQRRTGTHRANYQQPDSDERNSVWITTVAYQAANDDNENSVSNNEIRWILDSGCTDHIINNEKYFEEYKELKESVNVYLGDNRIVKATKIGSVASYFDVFGEKKLIVMKNVFYIKEMKTNLISYSKILESKNIIVSKGKWSKIINEKNKVIAIASKENGLYIMKSRIKSNETRINTVNKNTNDMSEKEKWHRVLGHVNFKYLDILVKNQLLNGIPSKIEGEFMKCKTCIENKMSNSPFKNERSKAKKISEIIHTDVCGPFKTVGFRGEKYFISFIDDYSKVAKVFIMKSKTEVYDCMKEFVNECENITNERVKILRCDNGTEYINNNIYNFAKEKGIIINNCPAYVHELNGTAERFNRTIMNISRCLLTEAKVDRKYWPEIVCAATYIKNRTLANTIERKTPYEIFFGKKPNVSHLRLYGSKVFVKIPEHKRVNKFDKKADMGILIGYSNVGYRVLLNNKILVVRHVDIVEENIKCIGLNMNESENENNDIRNEDNEHSDNADINMKLENKHENVNETSRDTEVRRSERIRKFPTKYNDYQVYNSSIFVNFCSTNIPSTFEEAMESEESKFWRKAMDKEIECLSKNKTWELVENINKKKALDVRWIFTKKPNKMYKARLVVRGFQQTDEIDELYSPVAKMQTLKLLLSFCCQMGIIIEQMDVETAFLNSKINSEVYIKQPKGYEDGSSKVCKLIKALYGLKESPRLWYECLDKVLSNIEFKRNIADPCLYSQIKGKDKTYILIFVDDLLICSKSQNQINRIKNVLTKNFTMKDLGRVKEYLGINIDYEPSKNKLNMSQTKYIEALARRYNVENSKTYNTPMEVNLKIEKSDNCEKDIKYRNLIGALLYISAATRPDINFSVNYLSRYQNCYSETHYKYALRILKYLNSTKNLKLMYKKDETREKIECYVDADWAGDNLERKSTTGYIIKLFGNVIYWKSKKQKSVTKATTFAEYVALSEAVSELKFIREILNVFEIQLNEPINIYEDNASAIEIANKGNFTKNSKHIEVHYHYVHEYVRENFIKIIKVNTDENIADIFTKALSREKFEKFRKLLNLM